MTQKKRNDPKPDIEKPKLLNMRLYNELVRFGGDDGPEIAPFSHHPWGMWHQLGSHPWKELRTLYKLGWVDLQAIPHHLAYNGPKYADRTVLQWLCKTNEAGRREILKQQALISTKNKNRQRYP